MPEREQHDDVSTLLKLSVTAAESCAESDDSIAAGSFPQRIEDSCSERCLDSGDSIAAGSFPKRIEDGHPNVEAEDVLIITDGSSPKLIEDNLSAEGLVTVSPVASHVTKEVTRIEALISNQAPLG